ncbi:glycerate kinase [Orenia metallireducens]|jgi:glycerate kinase|uniref:Glycerate kinase n=1 Tax=Orenia metallireducens TaxID=1413210 RepID=A0A285GZW5_9FIRM|nr:glycerate kinase [Orenia metallireducens]PRX21795.1 glycerate kinase [Orenia metallireducens]SNY29062.1 glycerate kinase [Orenia metallireducens]
MKILIAPDSFKGSLTALEVAENIEKGILRILPDAEVLKVPMADGGEGTLQSLVDANQGEVIEKEVVGPLGDKVEGYFGYLAKDNTGVVEMAVASGLPLISEQDLNPMKTTTYGTGELIKAALDKGVKELIIGIGGSATNDGGVGMAQALGVKFLDSSGEEIGFGGGELDKIESIDMSGLDPRIKDVKIRVACDVTNCLYGPEGAAHIYGPQKGATPEMIKILDDNLRHLAEVVKRDLAKDVQSIVGGGAAGGLGAGLVAFLDAKLETGVDIILDATNLAARMKGVDLVITGEGRLDSQTVNGKTPIGVAKKAKEFGLPVIAISAIFGDGVEKVLGEGIDAVFNMYQDPSVSMEDQPTEEWLQFIAEQIMRALKIETSAPDMGIAFEYIS